MQATAQYMWGGVGRRVGFWMEWKLRKVKQQIRLRKLNLDNRWRLADELLMEVG